MWYAFHVLSESESEVAQLCPTLCDSWTVAHQTPPSMGFSRQEYWSGLLFPSPGDLPDSGIEPGSPALQADSWLSEPPGKPQKIHRHLKKHYSRPVISVITIYSEEIIRCTDTYVYWSVAHKDKNWKPSNVLKPYLLNVYYVTLRNQEWQNIKSKKNMLLFFFRWNIS